MELEKLVGRDPGIEIAQGLKWQRFFLKPWHPRKIHDGPEGEEQIVIFEPSWTRIEARAGGDHFVFEINGVHFAGEQLHSRAEPPDGRDGIDNPNGARNHLWQYRLKDEVVLSIDKGDLYPWIPSDELLELHGGVHAAKATAKNKNATLPPLIHPQRTSHEASTRR